jgi:peptidyl-Asp metalloendopeptidase
VFISGLIILLTFKKKLLFAVIASTLSSSVLATPQLFTVVEKDVNSQDTPLLRSLQEEHKDYRLVNINKDILFSRSSSFLFNADGESVPEEIRATSLKRDSAGIDVWRGSSENEQSTATFAVDESGVVGAIRLSDGSFYEIYPAANGLHALVKIDTSHISADEHDDVWDETSDAKQHEFNERLSNNDNYNTSTAITKIKILYVYTNQTRAKFSPNPAQYASLLTDELNISHERSETLTQFESMGAVDAKIDESSMASMLSQMEKANTVLGKLVAEKRAETRADLVVLISKADELCGTAKGWGPYSIVNQYCAIENRSLAHEIGHNFGLKHNEDEATWPLYANGYGVPGKFRTIMSKKCTPACNKIDYFSSPTKSSHGQPIGTAASNDAVRFIKERRFIVANYYANWEKQFQLNGGALPANQFYEISLTDNQTNKTTILDHAITKPGEWDWPYEVSVAVNNFFPKDILAAGELTVDGNVVPKNWSSFENYIWLHQDKLKTHKVDVQRRTYAVVRGGKWADEMAISGGDGVSPNTTVMLTIKNKNSGQALEKYYFNNDGESLSATSWPHQLAQTINSHNSPNVIAGELKDGIFSTITGSGYRNRLWFPLEKKNDLTAEFSTLNITENPWFEQTNVFGDKFQTDLAAGTVITVAVKNSSGVVVEQRSVAIPDGEMLSRYRWPAYLAHEINKSMTQIRLGGKEADGSIKVVEWSQYLNYMWKKERANQTIVVTFNK